MIDMTRGLVQPRYVGRVSITETENPVTVAHGLTNHVGKPVRPIMVLPVLVSDGTTAPSSVVSVAADQTDETNVVLYATGPCEVDLYVW
jgi:hypothetical protein